MRFYYFPRKKIIPVIIVIALLVVSSVAFALSDDEKKQWQKDGSVIWQVKVPDKVVALTFEDGPDEKLTPEILHLLKQNNAKATFFVVGYKAKEQPELVKRIKDEGHQVESHSMTHPNLLKLSPQSIESQMKTADITIERIIGQKPKYFRPPQGKINKTLIDIIKKRNQKILLWTLTPADFPYNGVLPKDTTLPELIPSGSIITIKDDNNYKQETMRVLYFLLVALSNEKYKFVTVDELVSIKDAEINGDIFPPKASPNQNNPRPYGMPGQPGEQLGPKRPGNQQPNQISPPNQLPAPNQPPATSPDNPQIPVNPGQN